MVSSTLVVLTTLVMMSSASTQFRQVKHTSHFRRHPKCPPGMYSLSPAGIEPCYECPAGSYSNAPGATKCTPANPGYFVSTSKATAATPCSPGSYSDALSSVACSPCPSGHECPDLALTKPAPCSPGHYSTGGNVTSCTPCAPGSFNDVHGATSCCACCAGQFSAESASTSCTVCPASRPFSDPGTTSKDGCSSQKGRFAPDPTCTRSPSNTCVAQPPPSPPATRRSLHPPRCLKPGQKACPSYSAAVGRSRSKLLGYDCVDIVNDLESCGGCVDKLRGSERSSDGGRDCSAIPNVDSVRCEHKRCMIDSCRRGFVVSSDGENCDPIPTFDLVKQGL